VYTRHSLVRLAASKAANSRARRGAEFDRDLVDALSDHLHRRTVRKNLLWASATNCHLPKHHLADSDHSWPAAAGHAHDILILGSSFLFDRRSGSRRQQIA